MAKSSSRSAMATIVPVLAAGVLSQTAPQRSQAAAVRGPLLVYFGTYTGGASRGIYVSRLDASSGWLGPPELAAASENPSFLAAHPSGRFLYAVNEVGTFAGAATGAASAFAIDPASGRLTLLNQSATGGTGPCYVSLDRTSRHVLVANYGGGSVASLPVAADGRLGAASSVVRHQGRGHDPARQEAPHAHSIDADPANKFVLAADLGLDKVLVYRLDQARGTLVAHDPPFAAVKPGAGPRHVAVRPDGRFAYVLNEMHMTLTAFRYDAERGRLAEEHTVSTLPEGTAVAEGFSGAEVLVHPSGRFLYASNRGHDTLAVFAVDAASGKLKLAQHVGSGGRTPRGFGIDPSGRWLLSANQKSDRVVVFRIDPATGALSATGQQVEVGTPVAVAFVSLPAPAR